MKLPKITHVGMEAAILIVGRAHLFGGKGRTGEAIRKAIEAGKLSATRGPNRSLEIPVVDLRRWLKKEKARDYEEQLKKYLPFIIRPIVIPAKDLIASWGDLVKETRETVQETAEQIRMLSPEARRMIIDSFVEKIRSHLDRAQSVLSQ